MKNKLFQAAMGDRDGDTLTLQNEWHDVLIVRDKIPGVANGYLVYGENGCSSWPTLTAAVTAALEELALYERGRCD